MPTAANYQSGGQTFKDMGDGTYAVETVPTQNVAGVGAQTIRVNSGFQAPGQTIKNYTGSQLVTTGVPTVITLETVTTGKTYAITDIVMSFSDAVVHEVQIKAGSTVIFDAQVKGDTAPLQVVGIESQPSATTGTVVAINIPAFAGTPTFFYFIGGLEF